jgi:hypothetical protein
MYYIAYRLLILLKEAIKVGIKTLKTVTFT